MTDSEPDGEGRESDDDSGSGDFETTVERAFTCTLCGFGMVHEVPVLQGEVSGVCHNCGDWTSQRADRDVLVEAARETAAHLAGPVLTEKQALAYVLRERLGADRETTAEVMDSSPSNVDNLQRRASEQLEDAERIVQTLDELRIDDPNGGTDDDGTG